MYNELHMRRYPFENIHNFRDLGGYPIGRDAMTRWGRVFRSARLSEATPDEIEQLKAVGIRTVIDLRTRQETRTHPDAGQLDTQLGWRNVSVLNDVQANLDALERETDVAVQLPLLYQKMITDCGEGVGRLMLMIAERLQTGGVLFHCTAGKDRTGIVAMFLLSICGVDDMDIVSDYQVSHTYNLQLFPDDLTGSDAENMLSLLRFLQQRYNGPIAYLRSVGVTEEALQAIRYAMRQAV